MIKDIQNIRTIEVNSTLMGGFITPLVDADFLVMEPFNNYSLDNMPGEVWREIPFGDGRFQISNLGRVKSKQRMVKSSYGAQRTAKERILKTHLLNIGYYGVSICIDKITKVYQIHSLLMRSFVDEDYLKKGLVVNHKDGNKLNNSLDNLEVVTYKENSKHAIDTGLNINFGENHKSSKISNKTIVEIKNLFNAGLLDREIAAMFNISRAYVQQIRTGIHRKRG